MSEEYKVMNIFLDKGPAMSQTHETTPHTPTHPHPHPMPQSQESADAFPWGEAEKGWWESLLLLQVQMLAVCAKNQQPQLPPPR